MISKWHVKVYWYTILTMIIFIVFIMIPDSATVSKTPPDNYNTQMKKLASDNLKSKSAFDRARVSRKYYNLQKQKDMKSSEVTFNFIPLKFLLVLVMCLFTYLVIQNFWARRPKTVSKES